MAVPLFVTGARSHEFAEGRFHGFERMKLSVLAVLAKFDSELADIRAHIQDQVDSVVVDHVEKRRLGARRRDLVVLPEIVSDAVCCLLQQVHELGNGNGAGVLTTGVRVSKGAARVVTIIPSINAPDSRQNNQEPSMRIHFQRSGVEDQTFSTRFSRWIRPSGRKLASFLW